MVIKSRRLGRLVNDALVLASTLMSPTIPIYIIEAKPISNICPDLNGWPTNDGADSMVSDPRLPVAIFSAYSCGANMGDSNPIDICTSLNAENGLGILFSISA